MPDLFAGDSVALEEADTIDFTRWINGAYSDNRRPHFPTAIDPIVEACILEMRTKYHVKVRLCSPRGGLPPRSSKENID
jgi:hypothetical protein